MYCQKQKCMHSFFSSDNDFAAITSYICKQSMLHVQGTYICLAIMYRKCVQVELFIVFIILLYVS